MSPCNETTCVMQYEGSQHNTVNSLPARACFQGYNPAVIKALRCCSPKNRTAYFPKAEPQIQL